MAFTNSEFAKGANPPGLPPWWRSLVVTRYSPKLNSAAHATIVWPPEAMTSYSLSRALRFALAEGDTGMAERINAIIRERVERRYTRTRIRKHAEAMFDLLTAFRGEVKLHADKVPQELRLLAESAEELIAVVMGDTFYPRMSEFPESVKKLVEKANAEIDRQRELGLRRARDPLAYHGKAKKKQ